MKAWASCSTARPFRLLWWTPTPRCSESIDEFRHGWGEGGGCAHGAIVGARARLGLPTSRSSEQHRSDLQPTVIGVLCERAGVCPRRNRRRARSPRLPTSRSSEQHVLTCSRR